MTLRKEIRRAVDKDDDSDFRIDRSAFLYLGPRERDTNSTFSACGACRLWVDKVEGCEGGRCLIHGSDVVVDEADSCGYWLAWPDGKVNETSVKNHAKALAQGMEPSVVPTESGLVEGPVQCRHCEFFESREKRCGLYSRLNKETEGLFALDEEVSPYGCCNAWTGKDE